VRLEKYNRRLTACLLLCALFMLLFVNYCVLPRSGAHGGGYAAFSASAASAQKDRDVFSGLDYNAEEIDVLAVFDAVKTERPPTVKRIRSGFSGFIHIPVMLLAFFIYFTRSRDAILTARSSDRITAALHDKDGMK